MACPWPSGGAGGLQGAHPVPAGGAPQLQADGAGGGQDQTASEPSNSQSQPDGTVGQAGHGGGGERHRREEEELAEAGGAEDEDAEGGWLAG